jgi:hypothetical protein
MKQPTPAEIPSDLIPYVSAVSVHYVTSLGRIKCRSFDSRNISRIDKLHATDSSRSVSFSFPVSLTGCHHRQERLLSSVLPHFRPCAWLPMSHLNNIRNVRAGVVCRVPCAVCQSSPASGGRARRPHSLLSAEKLYTTQNACFALLYSSRLKHFSLR